jgi:magnesium chelatase family protein
MLARCCGAALVGLDAIPVAVEVDIAPGLPGLLMVGLPDAAVQESRERVRAALRNSDLRPPLTRVIVNLAPADLRKEGPAFDLPIALALLAASGQLDPAALAGVWCAGELGLDGRLRPVRGALALALAARRGGARALLLPSANGGEAALVDDLAVWPATDLKQALAWLRDPQQQSAALAGGTAAVSGALSAAVSPAVTEETEGSDTGVPTLDLADVRGQPHGRRALEIAAAGGHHLLLVGPPGSGKTMLARRLPGLLPPLSRQERLELTLLHSVAGLHRSAEADPEPGSTKARAGGAPLLSERPFRSPHHSCSSAALVGGGSVPRPGELSLAHHGVLFLDELAEFRRDVLNQLRQPLEQGEIWLSRARQRLRFPCSVSLVAATNPCPCGWHGDPERPCSCGTGLRQRYWSRLAGPLLDRLDLQVVMWRLEASDLRPRRCREIPAAESSREVAARAAAARERMRRRNPGGVCNARLPAELLPDRIDLEDDALQLWQRAVSQRRMSARGAGRVLSVARTIADLEGARAVGSGAIAEALSYRSFDRGTQD